jgi:antiviral defense system Shedu protein SduA
LAEEKIYYIGARPKVLRADGAFSSGKTILENLAFAFKRFELILTQGKSRLVRKGNLTQVYFSTADLKDINKQLFARRKDVTQSAVGAKLSELFPKYFPQGTRLFNYTDGMLAGVLTNSFPPTRMSPPDRKALAEYIPGFIASGVAKSSVSSKPTAVAELDVLQPLAKDLERRIKNDKSERTWQDYLKQNITVIQQGYIALISKANIGVLGTRFPDFLLVTYDEYLDILEIKTPATEMLSEDADHKNYYWNREISKAIAQIENYIQAVEEIGPTIRTKAQDLYGIDLRVIKPRGIIFAGNSSQFKADKLIQDDFRLLNQGLKNVTVVTYDELLTRLQNYIHALSGTKSKPARNR